ncbi:MULTISPECIES: carbohydrate ABC transporter permease [unclassified Paenibacillus]|uniref:carbohydrate ABC transporter permease n=1 Tax=unclassified Paenibacillus TaxID=185978 RepID=UPI001053F740|nr:MULTISPECIES: carbohydrate ABC transporter permease [unclassified Paenibacillus]NIK66587.1 putative aldouronate transport system permease protein [Paenibacillus sp. BK720]TCN00564.1 putative aldouronate transport system permease protein [Paenibacillus sp. BK033]
MHANRFSISQSLIIILISLFSLSCLFPFIMVISGSLSTEKDIMDYGYTVWPHHITLDSYKILLLGSNRIIDAYGISILVTVAGTILSVFVTSMGAYVMARRSFKYRNILSVYVIITMLFNGGLVPWYIICVHYLNLKDTLWALILPMLANAFNMFLIRNFMNSIPEEINESAKMDGAGEFKIFYKLIMPLSLPVLATVGLFVALSYWNDWFLGLMFVDKQELQPLQLLLRTLVSNVEFLKSSSNASAMQRISAQIPSESIKMALTVVTIGPIVFLYPFLQRYFVKGLMVGAVKG